MAAGVTVSHEHRATPRNVDPDMEQILNSIRRIIADDQAALGMPLEDRPARVVTRRPVAPDPAPATPEPSASAPVAQRPGANGPQEHATRPAPERAANHPHEQGVAAPEQLPDAQERPDSAGAPVAERPAVRLAPATAVDFRPPEARRARASAPAPDEAADAGFADAVSRAVSERIEQMAQAALASALSGEPGGLSPSAPGASAAPPAADGADGLAPAVAPPAADPASAGVAAGLEAAAASRPEPVPGRASRPGDLYLHDLSQGLSHGEAVFGVAVTHRPADQSQPVATIACAGAAPTPLVSPAAAARISSAFDALTRRVAAERARTMEETVTDMLRPMLAQWLEANLPGIVERMVAEQLARLASSGGAGES